MEKHSIKEITQPSDLFGLEILPESIFETEYGKLTMGHVLVPDFSSDEKGQIRLKEEFDNIKEFIKENELSKKGEIADIIHKNEFSFSFTASDGSFIEPNYVSRSSEAFSEFVRLLQASIRARLFEMGFFTDSRLCPELLNSPQVLSIIMIFRSFNLCLVRVGYICIVCNMH